MLKKRHKIKFTIFIIVYLTINTVNLTFANINNSVDYPIHIDILNNKEESILLTFDNVEEILIMKEIDDSIKRASDKYDIEINLIKAIVALESNFNPFLEGDLHLNDIAVGLMQLRRPAVEDLGLEWNKEELKNIDYNIEVGTRYLHLLKNHYFPLYEGEGSVPTACQLARMFNGGPKGYTLTSTLYYKKSFLKHYNKY